MKTMIGDMWDITANWRCIPTNGTLKRDGSLVMGAGVAQRALSRYRGLDIGLGRYIKKYGNRPFMIRAFGVISFPTKDHWKDPSTIAIIENSAKLLVELVSHHAMTGIVLPKVGCGLGGLDWSDVEPVLSEILDDRFTVVEKTPRQPSLDYDADFYNYAEDLQE